MPSIRFTRRQVPAALLLVVGIALVAVGGYGVFDTSQTKYDYEVDPAGGRLTGVHAVDGLYSYPGLSETERDTFRRAVEARGPNTTVDADAAGGVLGEPGVYVVLYEGTYHCLDVQETEAGAATIESGDRVCPGRERGSPVVHEFSTLSDRAQHVFERARAATNGRVWLYGNTPPEFHSSHAPGLNHGRYLIRYDHDYYRLAIRGRSGLGLNFLFLLALGVATVGIAVTSVAYDGLRRGRVRSPSTVLVGVLVLASPQVAHLAGIDLPAFVTLETVPVASALAALVTWIVLAWVDVN